MDTRVTIIIYIIANKFDISTHREWESYNFKGTILTINDMNIFLKQSCELLEKINFNVVKRLVKTSQHNKKLQSWSCEYHMLQMLFL